MVSGIVPSWVATCVLVAAVSRSTASADVLIESYRDRRPADADRVLAPLRDELSKVGVAVRPADIIAAGDALPLSGVADPARGSHYSRGLSDQVELGASQVFHGNYSGGVASLEAILRAARDNPALIVGDETTRVWLTRAYATIAFAKLRQRDLDAATAAIAEQYRSFPEYPIGRLVGPEVASFADAVRKTLDAGPRGKLQVVVSSRDAQVFVDEVPRGRGAVLLSVPPGSYRVLVMRQGVSRRWAVSIAADRSTKLEVDLAVDSMFTPAAAWVGFAWPDGMADQTLIAVSRYARASRQHDIFAVSIVDLDSRRLLVGRMFEKGTGALLRSKAIELGAEQVAKDDRSCERALAQYLIKGDLSGCLLDVPADEDAKVPGTASVRPSGDRYLLPGLVAGAGTMAMIGGLAWLVDKDVPPADQARTQHVVSAPAVGLMVGGGLALGAAAYLATRGSEHAGDDLTALRGSLAPVYAAAGTATAAFVAGGYLLGINGKGTCGHEGSDACRYNYATAKYGWSLLGIGTVASVFGIYWYIGARSDSAAPLVTLAATEQDAFVGLSGRF